MFTHLLLPHKVPATSSSTFLNSTSTDLATGSSIGSSLVHEILTESSVHVAFGNVLPLVASTLLW